MKINLESIETLTKDINKIHISTKDLCKIPLWMLQSFMFSRINSPQIPKIESQSDLISDTAYQSKGYVHPMDVFIYIFLKCDPL
ncbi:hypothetical protein, partial [Salmonella sp. s51228]|uniref:hypothetical protein n=1 Tax=Salmonella sp. s51228 TaxID=3159652 RepID=UPI0039819286